MSDYALTHLQQALILPNGHRISNRLVKSSMSECLAEPDGGPSDALIELYRRWAASGAGILLTGNVAIDEDGRAEPRNVVITDDRHFEGLKRWAEAAQFHGSQLWMQINHAGRQSTTNITRQPLAPSAVKLKMGGLFGKPRAASDAEIRRLIGRYAFAAGLAKRAGFSGVQIHGAHGYLVSQFLSPLTNQRTDRWGGSLENRMRFLLEILRAMRRQVGTAFPIAVKLNSADFQRGGFDSDEAFAVIEALVENGIDLIEISGGNYEQPAMMTSGQPRKSTLEREAYFLEFAKRVRAATAVPLLLTGGIRTASTMAKVVARDGIDLIGLGRPMAVEPDLPWRILNGEAESAKETNPSVGIRLFDTMLSVIWYQRQLQRMGQGKHPKMSLSRWNTLLLGLLDRLPIRRPLRRDQPTAAAEGKLAPATADA